MPDAGLRFDVVPDIAEMDRSMVPDAERPDQPLPDQVRQDALPDVSANDVLADKGADDATDESLDAAADTTADEGLDGAADTDPDRTPPDLSCAMGQTLCEGACVDLSNSVAHCGACGNACAMGQLCSGGTCRAPCGMGQTRCGADCVDVQTSTAHCGTCDNACPSGAMCVAGMCVTCTSPRTMCGAVCVDTATDASHCGMCGRACPMGEACVAGACVCPMGQTRCGGVCVDTRSNDNHCGACGVGCPMGQTCTAGTCACPMGQTRCGSVCVNVMTDETNCGACGRSCGAAQRCEGGVCACPSGQTACGTSCVDTSTDVANCGGCNNACAMGQSCTSGRCTCPTGQTLCGAGSSARCVSTATDLNHCGMCGRACATGQSCVGGVCASAPANDRRAEAIALSLATTSTTVTVDTTGASNDTRGPTGCTCTAGRDVFYTFTLTAEEIVYADTFDGNTWDSSLFLQDAMGNNLPSQSGGFATCNDDACGGFRSQLAARLGPGTYYLVLSGCSQGVATIRFQHLPVGSGTVENISPTGTRTITATLGATSGRINPGCGAAGPENTYWWTTCPSFTEQPMHITTCGGASFDTVIHQHSAGRSPVMLCNDDACGLQSNLWVTLPAGAGLHAYYVDAYGTVTTGPYTVRHAFNGCFTGWGVCGTTCLDLQNDRTNCGTCGLTCTGGQICQMGRCVCPSGQTLCGSTCRDTRTDASNCGACGAACVTGASCVAGVCTFGEGTTPLDVASGTLVINDIAASANAAAGSETVTLSNVVGSRPFRVGDRVLLHQTQAATGPVGHYEYRRVTAATATGLTLDAPLANAYVTSPTHRAQVLVVPEVGALTVAEGATLTARAWDGNSGGILALDVSGAVEIAGTVHMNGRGFRGRSHPCPYRCGRGYQGESALGLGEANIVANGAGGGGGGRGQDDGAGGGGGHGEPGIAGPNRMGCGVCSECVDGAIPGGAGGTVAGMPTLSRMVLFGGAGGEGGADEDGGNPGAGGNGGGIVLLRARSITLVNSGAIQANGGNGLGGNQNACGGVGCGMGGGGGGAGGSVRLVTVGALALGVNQVRATGGLGGGATCGSTSGGAGAVGRIGLLGGSIAGSTLPLYVRD